MECTVYNLTKRKDSACNIQSSLTLPAWIDTGRSHFNRQLTADQFCVK